MTKEVYLCEECSKVVPKGECCDVPECCGKPMKVLPLEECVKPPADAEHARFDDEDEPCSDGRTGK